MLFSTPAGGSIRRETDDLVLDPDPGHCRQAVGLQTGADHQFLRLPGAVMGADTDVVEAFLDGGHGAVETDFPAAGTDHPGHGLADFAIVDDAGGVEKQPAQADDIRLALAQFIGIEAFDLHAIELGAGVQRLHALHLQWRGGHQQLAADLELDPVLGAELLGGLGAALAQVGLEAARCVVDAGMDHAAVVPGLVFGQGAFFFQDDQGGAGLALEQFHRGGQADDAAADDAKIINHCEGYLGSAGLVIRLSD